MESTDPKNQKLSSPAGPSDGFMHSSLPAVSDEALA